MTRYLFLSLMLLGGVARGEEYRWVDEDSIRKAFCEKMPNSVFCQDEYEWRVSVMPKIENKFTGQMEPKKEIPMEKHSIEKGVGVEWLGPMVISGIDHDQSGTPYLRPFVSSIYEIGLGSDGKVYWREKP